MNWNDRKYLRKANDCDYWNYHKVYIWIRLVQSEKVKEEMRNIASLLYDRYCE